MNRFAVRLFSVAMIVPASVSGQEAVVPAPTSGIESRYIDPHVRPQDDFYRYVNGGWLTATQIPADAVRVSAASQLAEKTREQLRAIVDDAAKDARRPSATQKKIARLHASFLDEARVERLGLAPLKRDLRRIAQLRTRADLLLLFGDMGRFGVGTPIGNSILNDSKDATVYVQYVHQSGLGLPGREYYVSNDSGLAEIRVAYQAHVRNLLSLAGEPDAEGHAQRMLALETALARSQWSIADSSDPVKTDNRMSLPQLVALAPGADWKSFFVGNGTLSHCDSLVIAQPGYFVELARLARSTPMEVWRVYLRYHLLSAYAPYLSKAFVDENFAFESTVLRGVPVNSPRWKRSLDLVEGLLGEGLGQLYVERYVSPPARVRVADMFRNFVTAFNEDIAALEWMGPETKRRAKEKLLNVRAKIGYPDRWRAYAGLEIVDHDLVGNVRRARAWEYQRNVDKLGRPVDRDEWYMTPQTPDAYEWLPQNEIVIGAALLQPPFFDAAADDAVNYGAIGGTIGHELSHGFDNIGSQYDAQGTLLGKPGWFTPEDQQRFDALTHGLVEQYAALEPLPGHRLDGEQTLSENIADVAGAAIAYRAYQLSLRGREAPVIDGLTGDQRFFMGWAQRRRGNYRDNELIRIIESDEHSPPSIRAVMPLMNLDAFYRAFPIQPGDAMYLAPEKRIRIW